MIPKDVDQSHDGSGIQFNELLFAHLLPEFCDDSRRNYPHSALRADSILVTDIDARDFVRAWQARLIEHSGRGLYKASRSAASEQFFWQGRKGGDGARTITLWLEPVITVAALARLHFEFGWPKELLGTQSSDYAFDLVAFLDESSGEHIAGEVKKTAREVTELIAHMRNFLDKGQVDAVGLQGKALNAYRKLASLAKRRAPIFWVVGPGGLNKAFAVNYDGDLPRLMPAPPSILNFADG